MVEPKPPLLPNALLDDWPNWKLLFPPPPKVDMMATVDMDQYVMRKRSLVAERR